MFDLFVVCVVCAFVGGSRAMSTMDVSVWRKGMVMVMAMVVKRK